MINAQRILLIEDSPIIREVVTDALSDAGYELDARDTFAELDAASINGFDLILMDVQMPELYGDDVASVLRYERGITVPIYLFSTLDDAELAARVAETGLDGFISKAVGMEHVVAEIRRILGDVPQ